MDKRSLVLSLAAGLLVFAALLTGCGGKTTTTPTVAPNVTTVAAPTVIPPASIAPPDSTADGATLLQERCTGCHSLGKVQSAHLDQARWTRTVADMVNKGASLSADEQKVLVDYLVKTYGP